MTETGSEDFGRDVERSDEHEVETAEAEATNYIRERAAELAPEMIDIQTDIHKNPELGGEEVRTAGKVVEYLRSLGIEVIGQNIGLSTGEGEDHFRGTGVVGLIRGNGNGKTVALRADMDALPVQEVGTNEPRSAVDGKMHGCGHDVHTASLLGAAKMLQELAQKGQLDGDVLLIFQPSEEKTHQKESGAVQIVRFLEENGWRDKIGAFLGLHVFRSIERGMIRVKEGVHMASSGEIEIKLHASGGHIMNAYEIPNLNVIFSRLTVRLDEVFRPIYEQKKGLIASGRTEFSGKGYNVLPAQGESTWVVRIADPLYREISKDALNQIRTIVQEEAVRSGLGKEDIEVVPRQGYRPVIHRDAELVHMVREAASEVLPNYQLSPQSDQVMFAGEDFSTYLELLRGRQINGVFVQVGGANPAEGIPTGPHHAPDFRVDPNSTVDLAEIYANFAQHFVNQPESEA
ncbi:MAG: M20 family metallopeptidase [bacterium]|nr:M20 family metallopeptidase [bacterium]